MTPVDKRHRRVVLAVVIPLVAVACGLAVVNAVWAPAPEPTAPPCGEFDEADYARVRLEAEAAGGGVPGIEEGRVLQRILSVSCPAQYGGLRVPEGVVVVYWTGDVTELTAILPSDRFRVEQAWFTERQLRAAIDAAGREFDARGIRADMSTDVSANTVEVNVAFWDLVSASRALTAAGKEVELNEAQERVRDELYERRGVPMLAGPD